jgi:hypothetical protein
MNGLGSNSGIFPVFRLLNYIMTENLIPVGPNSQAIDVREFIFHS